jgi:hypothetical protein
MSPFPPDVTFAQLKGALLDAFTQKSQFTELVLNARGVSLDRIAIGDDLDDIATKVITRADSEAWLHTLIEVASGLRHEHAQLTRIHRAWQVPASTVPVNHAKALLLPGKTVLIDRAQLHDALTTLQQANGARVLIVDGEPLSGKTYSLHYISYLASTRRTFRYAYVDLERVPRNAQNKIDAVNLGDAIGLALLGEKFPPPTDLNLLTWLDQYGMWLERKLPNQPIYWLVIDNFRKVSLEESVPDLVAELAIRTYRNLGAIRLVLLSYGDREALQSRVIGVVEYERIVTIDQNDIIRFFSQLYLDESRGRNVPHDNSVLAQRVFESATRVLASIPENGARRLEALCRSTWLEAQRILRPPADPAVDPLELLIEEVNRLVQRGVDETEPERG